MAIDPVGRRDRVPARQVEVAGHVVAGPGRDDPQRGAGAGDGLDPEVDHPVPAAHDERLDAVGDALAGQVERLVGVAALEVAHHEAGVAQPAERGVAGARAPALAGRRVGEEGDLARLPATGRD